MNEKGTEVWPLHIYLRIHLLIYGRGSIRQQNDRKTGIFVSEAKRVPKFGQGGASADDTERRSESPTLCTFYNADFIIYSSMGSFYVPCVAMLLLYWQIFRVINDRVRRTLLGTAARPSSGNDAGQPPATSAWRGRLTGRRTVVRAVFNRLTAAAPCRHRQN